MNQSFQIIQVARDDGQNWFEGWLKAGFDVSTAVLARNPLDQGSFRTIVSKEASTEAINFPDTPDVPGAVADEGLAWLLESMKRDGALSLVIEDDLAEKSDPAADDWTIPSAFIESRIIHWCDLKSASGKDAVETIMKGASCILNAFVITKSVANLGLVDRQEVPEGLGIEVASSLLAMITFAFDETSFAVWDRR